MSPRLPRLLSRSLIAGVPIAALCLAAVPAANAATASHAAARPSAAAQARSRAVALIRKLQVGEHATNHRVGAASHGIYGLSHVSSNNWAGYADVSSGYSRVTATWTEPSVSCTSTTALAAFWVGIDGYSSDSVEQDGTLAECYGDHLYQFSWWEMYPTNSIQTVGGSVAAGDQISASVVRSGTSYTLKVTDSTHSANSFTTTQSCSNCANSSAEWIAEAPSGSGGIYPLPNFHSWTAANATVTSGSTTGVISTFPDYEITMTGNSGNKATPGSLNAAGNSFTVTWNRST